MTVDWNQYIVISEKLLENQNIFSLNDEMVFRCVISRAYYAAYCITRDCAIKNRLFTASNAASDHKTLRDTLRNKGYYNIAENLNKLRYNRDEADYNSKTTICRMDAEDAINTAKKICELTDTIS